MRKRVRRKSKVDPKQQIINHANEWKEAIHSGDENQAIEARKKADIIFQSNPEYQKPKSRMPRELYIIWQDFISYPYRDKLTKALNKYVSAIHSGDREKVLKSAKALENLWLECTGEGFPTTAPIWHSKPWAGGWFLLAQLPISIRYAKADPDRWKKDVDQTLTEIIESYGSGKKN